MAIFYNEEQRLFHLQAKDTSYIMQVVKKGYLTHIYWGKKVRNINPEQLLVFRSGVFSPHHDLEDKTYSLDTLPQEYPSYGNSDFRTPAYSIELSNGSTLTDMRYHAHRIIKGKPTLEGLPATYVEQQEEAQTLEIEMIDTLIGLKMILSYTVYEDLDVITRHVKFMNEGNEKLKILRALSMSIDFNKSDFDVMHLSGAWARERHIERRSLRIGNQSIESRRGASSHQHNPFIALMNTDATEDSGEVYGFSLVYSGNFLAQAEVDQYQSTRVSLGINPFEFSWMLGVKESFQTPEVVMVYSDKGIGKMSRTYHKLYRTRLCRGKFRDTTRPVLVNNWEATYFDFNADKIEDIAREAKDLGIELFVLDDGWFGKRNDDTTSLGDWRVNTNKLPGGLDDLAGRINHLGLEFGLWFEPEMVSVDSDLYRAHPDWCLHVPNRTRSEGRNQLILDVSRKEVQDYIINVVSNILKSASITYVKWDMNRSMTEIGSGVQVPERQKETAHRYILGVYRVMDEITKAYPNVLFESCSGGGGRFDPGILYYMPQTWTSDDTDAVERLTIQYGTSIVYPASSMGAHVSAAPNHQVHRNTSLKMRGDVAMSGNFGYELDLTRFTNAEKEEVKKQVASYKGVRELIQFGDMYRLLSPFEGNETAWMYVDEAKDEAFVAYFRVLGTPNAGLSYLKLKGLDPHKDYFIEGENTCYGGDALMYGGIVIPELEGDYQSVVWKIKKK